MYSRFYFSFGDRGSVGEYLGQLDFFARGAERESERANAQMLKFQAWKKLLIIR